MSASDPDGYDAAMQNTKARGGTVRRIAGVALGVLGILLGAFLTLHPFSSLAVLLFTVVAALVVAGIGELTAADPAGADGVERDAGDRRRWRWLRAGLYVAAALAVLVWPGATIRVVAVVVGVALIVGGALDLAEARRASGTRRWNALAGGISGVLFGALALAWPDVSVLVIAVVFGARTVVFGFRLLARSLRGPQHAATTAAADQPRVKGGWFRLLGSAIALAVAVVLAVVGIALARSAPSPDAFYTPPASVPGQPGMLLRSEPFTSAEIPAGAKAWRILYTTTRDEANTPAVASGLVIAPDRASTTAVPVIAWAHGTTGFASGCAPSILTNGLSAGAMMIQDQVIGKGWAMVATDYVGLGTEGPHPYLIGQGEGRSVLDAVRAAHQLNEVKLAPDTVVWGHSQGGHAALWAGMLASTYAPDLKIDGVAALAPASNLPGLITNLENVTGGELFASYVVQAYTDIYPDVTYADLIRPGARIIVQEMAQRCLAEKSTLVSILTVLTLDKPIWSGNPDTGAFHDALVANIPSGPIKAPLLLAQGAADTLVVPSAQNAYVKARCDAGYRLDYRTYQGRDHVPLVEPDSPLIPELLQWTADRFAGKPAKYTC